MGLSGPKKRTKISSDPNNTTWANNKDGYGQKILASQGWTPGEYLGAMSANHADHYTAANASHIRVLLREDNLGLGAQLGTSTADTFGLATLSGIFGRLNGKCDAEIQKQQDVQRDLQLQTYQTTKYGTMNFVSGGLLVGDKMEFPSSKMTASNTNGSAKNSERTKTEKRKKRKVVDKDVANDVEHVKRRKQNAVSEDQIASVEASSEDDSSAADRKKQKKRRHEAVSGEDVSLPTSDSQADVAGAMSKRRKEKVSSKDSSSEKASLKEGKRARKEERRLRRERKEAKRRQKSAKSSSKKSSKSSSTTSSSDTETPSVVPVAAVQILAPAIFAGSRHAVRQRYIQQKRLASMDPRAVQEILMLKSSA